MRSRAPALALLLLFAGCTYTPDPRALEGNIIAPGNFKAGAGLITHDGRVVRVSGTSLNEAVGR